MSRWTQPLFTNLLNLFLESSCPLCDRATAMVLCPTCERQILGCSVAKAAQSWCGDVPLLAWGTYGGALKRAIAALKYNNHPQLARPLGHWLAQAWQEFHTAAPPLLVVPIPIHAAKQQQRGFNQADLLAEAFCQITEIPLQKQGLARIRETEAQFKLSPELREQNLADAFVLGKDFLRRPPARAVLLLDDIYTTGATIRAAAKVLNQNHIQVYGVVAVARARFDAPVDNVPPSSLRS